MSLPKLYRGSVKDVLGPVLMDDPQQGAFPAVVFDYSDSYSVYDWGKMPDALPKKGEALAILAAHWFERIEKSETWREFSKSAEALELRKFNKFGAAFNEVGEKLQKEGLRTHYLGVAQLDKNSDRFQTQYLAAAAEKGQTVRTLVAKQVSVTKPTMGTILGRTVPDYQRTLSTAFPRLIPLEIVFRFGCPSGSSLLERSAQDPSYMSSRGYAELHPSEDQKWTFPFLEMFTKLETTDRPVSLAEGLAISGLSATQLQEVLFKTVWVAGLLKFYCTKAGLELADGKLEWAVDAQGQTILVDAIGPDELRILKDGIQLSKEFLRTYYRGTPWYELMVQSKQHATHNGIADWKKFVTMAPAPLSQQHKEVGSQLYTALTNRLTGRNWFPQSWDLDQVVAQIKELTP